MKINKSLLDEINSIKWFSNVGVVGSTTKKYLQVSSWQECEAYFASSEWENTTLEARNDLTSFLSKKSPNSYSEWNSLIKEGQAFLGSSVMPVIDQLNIPIEDIELLKACVRWDILGAIMEDAYSQYKKPSFFTELLSVYKKGHFPCGWNGEWPTGRLIIY